MESTKEFNRIIDTIDKYAYKELSNTLDEIIKYFCVDELKQVLETINNKSKDISTVKKLRNKIDKNNSEISKLAYKFETNFEKLVEPLRNNNNYSSKKEGGTCYKNFVQTVFKASTPDFINFIQLADNFIANKGEIKNFKNFMPEAEDIKELSENFKNLKKNLLGEYKEQLKDYKNEIIEKLQKKKELEIKEIEEKREKEKKDKKEILNLLKKCVEESYLKKILQLVSLYRGYLIFFELDSSTEKFSKKQMNDNIKKVKEINDTLKQLNNTQRKEIQTCLNEMQELNFSKENLDIIESFYKSYDNIVEKLNKCANLRYSLAKKFLDLSNTIEDNINISEIAKNEPNSERAKILEELKEIDTPNLDEINKSNKECQKAIQNLENSLK